MSEEETEAIKDLRKRIKDGEEKLAKDFDYATGKRPDLATNISRLKDDLDKREQKNDGVSYEVFTQHLKFKPKKKREGD